MKLILSSNGTTYFIQLVLMLILGISSIFLQDKNGAKKEGLVMTLEMKNLTKYYGNNCALDNLSLSLSNGIYGVLGANGAGKSTLMNLITDNVKRTSGEILYDGTDILKLGNRFRKHLGYMSQQQGFYDQISARAFCYI